MSKYYSIKRIKEVDAQFKMLLGGRNIGKSYATKQDVITECFNNGLTQFIYLRRWDEDIKVKNAINYFSDVDVKKITGGIFTGVYIYQSKIYLVNYDEDGKIKNKHHIGFTHALNQAERYKSQIFPNVKYIIYEEFITDKQYLKNEPNELQEYVSTIFRGNTGVVYLIGNTISKLCPYFNEWNLEKVNKMKTHDIVIFEKETEVIDTDGARVITVRIAIEMCGADSILSKMSFGDSANMIVKNTWRTKTVPTLTKEFLDKTEEIHVVFVYANNLCFKMSLRSYENSVFWYVTYHKRFIPDIDNRRVIKKDASFSPLHTTNFTPLFDTETLAFMLLKQNKIFYANNTCGSDFEQVLRLYHINNT